VKFSPICLWFVFTKTLKKKEKQKCSVENQQAELNLNRMCGKHVIARKTEAEKRKVPEWGYEQCEGFSSAY